MNDVVFDGGSTGDVANDGSDFTGAGSGAGAGAGVGALEVLVGAGVGVDGAGEKAGTGVGALPEEMAPFSRLTSFGGAVLPAKNSPAESAGSAEGARGKISAWKESACEWKVRMSAGKGRRRSGHGALCGGQ